ncbi:MAG: cupredoxin domain-containing protein [Rubrobacteraceae bacterium]
MNKALVLIPLTAIVLGGLFFVLRPDPPAAEPQAKTFDLQIRDGEMSPREIEVREGDRVNLSVSSDEEAEFHVHGYDLEREIEAGGTTKLSFAADLTGRFAIENHLAGEHDHDSDDHSHSEAEIGTLTVLPR